jgi:hypothetical protein
VVRLSSVQRFEVRNSSRPVSRRTTIDQLASLTVGDVVIVASDLPTAE